MSKATKKKAKAVPDYTEEQAREAAELCRRMSRFTDPNEQDCDDNCSTLYNCIMLAGEIFDPAFEMPQKEGVE